MSHAAKLEVVDAITSRKNGRVGGIELKLAGDRQFRAEYGGDIVEAPRALAMGGSVLRHNLDLKKLLAQEEDLSRILIPDPEVYDRWTLSNFLTVCLFRHIEGASAPYPTQMFPNSENTKETLAVLQGPEDQIWAAELGLPLN